MRDKTIEFIKTTYKLLRSPALQFYHFLIQTEEDFFTTRNANNKTLTVIEMSLFTEQIAMRLVVSFP